MIPPKCATKTRTTIPTGITRTPNRPKRPASYNRLRWGRRSVSVRNCGDPIAADPPGGWGGWGLGKPDRTVWLTARLSVAGTPVPTYDDGFPTAPPTPPALSAVLKVGSRPRGARLSCAAGRNAGPQPSY